MDCASPTVMSVLVVVDVVHCDHTPWFSRSSRVWLYSDCGAMHTSTFTVVVCCAGMQRSKYADVFSGTGQQPDRTMGQLVCTADSRDRYADVVLHFWYASASVVGVDWL